MCWRNHLQTRQKVVYATHRWSSIGAVSCYSSQMDVLVVEDGKICMSSLLYLGTRPGNRIAFASAYCVTKVKMFRTPVHVQGHNQCCHAPVVQDPLRCSCLVILRAGVYSPHVERGMWLYIYSDHGGRILLYSSPSVPLGLWL